MINFITPLYRYNNLKIIYSSIKHQISDFKWHLIEGDNKIGEENIDFLNQDERVFYYKIKTNYVWGHEQRNFFITNISANDEDWCYFLDDDNIVTGDLAYEISNIDNQEYDVILFSQKMGLTDITRLHGREGNMIVNYCDIGSFVVRYGFLKRTIIENEHIRGSDGPLCEKISKLENIKIKYLDNKYVRYNSLSLDIYN
jgi:hypothetical protein